MTASKPRSPIRKKRDLLTSFPSSVECLEVREMLAGNISASLSKGVLSITGTTTGDRVILEPGTQHGSVRISTENGTVNGQASAEIAGVTKDIRIGLGDGDDQLVVRDFGALTPILKNLQIDAGGGNDVIDLQNLSVIGNTTLLLSAGNDLLRIDDSQFAKKVKIDAGAGDDGVLIERRADLARSTQFRGKATLQLGTGNDTARLGVDGAGTQFVSSPKMMSIDGGSETDSLALSSLSAIRLRATSIEKQTGAALPIASVELSNDTGTGEPARHDRLTSDAGLAGTIANYSSAYRLYGGLEATPLSNQANLSSFVSANGAFSLSQGALQGLFPGVLTDGTHTFSLQLRDSYGEDLAPVLFTFTLDTVGPVIESFGLAAESNTGTIDDLETSLDTVTLAGIAAPNSTIRLSSTGQTVNADGMGRFQFTNIPLVMEGNVFQVTTADLAGNVTARGVNIVRSGTDDEASNLVQKWNFVAINAIKDDATPPPVASRGLAMLQIAVLDSVAGLLNQPGFLVSLTAPAGGLAEAAVIGASYRVLTYLFPAQRSKFDALRAQDLGLLPNDAGRAAGELFGQQIAQAVIDIRDVDGWNNFELNDPLTTTLPGAWVPTAPGYAEPLLPEWAHLTPFAMTSSDQFLPDAPPSLASDEYAEAYNEVKDYGGATGSLRTSDMTAIARFWADGGGTYSPPGHWNQIAEEVSATRGLSLYESARLFAALNVAMADAGIACWNSKFSYDLWRPVTAIHEADTDNNPDTVSDAEWRPLLITPNFPEYISGHSTFSAAAAEVLTQLLGDDVSFATSSIGFRDAQGAPVVRSFSDFWDAAEEAGQSRIYGGIHYQFSKTIGIDVGKSIGELVTQLFTVTTDITPPRIIIDQPSSGITTRENLTIQGRAFDNQSGVASVSVSIDGGVFQQLSLNVDNSFSLATQFLLNGTEDGSHVVRFQATDGVGLVSAVHEILVTLDTVPPSLLIDSPVVGEALQNGVVLAGNVSGTGSPIVLLTYQFDSQRPVPMTFDSATGSFSQSLNLSYLSTGSHTLTIISQDAAGNQTPQSITVLLNQQIPFGIAAVTPFDGADKIGSTFRPQVTFTRQVDPVSLTADNFYATNAAGQKLAATIVPAADGTFAWLFFDEPLPGGAKITIHVIGDTILAASDRTPLDADSNGVAGGKFVSAFTTVSLTPLAGTSLVGRLFDPGVDLLPMTFDDLVAGPDGILFTTDDVFKLPIAHAKIYIIGLEDQAVFTDSMGNFHFDTVPAGTVKLAIDGRTATNAPTGFFFPEMVMDLEMVVSAQNTVMGTMGTPDQREAFRLRKEVYLPRIQTSILQPVGGTETTVVNLRPEASVGLSETERQYLTLKVQPGTLLGPDGQPVSNPQVGISTVPPELVREMLPPGLLQHTFDITIQAPGAAVFSVPLTLTFPNVFNSAPGTQLNFLSFDHTTGRLVIEGTATVSADGQSVVTDPGMGITKPGWHGLTDEGSDTKGETPKKKPKPPEVWKDDDDGWSEGIELGLAITQLALELLPPLRMAKEIFAIIDSTTGLINDLLNFKSRGTATCTALGVLRTEVTRINTLVDAFLPVKSAVSKLDRIVSILDGILRSATAAAEIAECGPPSTSTWIKAAQELLFVASQARDMLDKVDVSRLLNTTATRLLKNLDDLYCTPESRHAEASGSEEMETDLLIDPETLELMQQTADLVGNVREVGLYFSPAEMASNEQILATAVEENNLAYEHYISYATDSDNAASLPIFYAITNLDNSAAPVIRGQVSSSSRLEGIFLSPNTRYEAAYFDPTTLQVAYSTFRTGPSGSETTMPTAIFTDILQLDSDGDGVLDPLDQDGDLLPNEAERIIGTNPNRFSTAGDSVSDGAKVRAGISPFGTFIAQSGIVGAVPLTGTAQDIEIHATSTVDSGLTAYVATGDAGLSIVNLASPQTPVVFSEFDLPGFATDVAVDPQLSIAAVAAGSAGLFLIDVANPAKPTVASHVSGFYSSVEVWEGRAFASNGLQLQTIDLSTGDVISTVYTFSSVVDISRQGATLFVLFSGGRLTAFNIQTGKLSQVGSIALPSLGTSVAIGDGVAYVGADNGFMTVNVASPSQMTLLSGVDNGQIAGYDIATNGNGLIVTVGSSSGVFNANATDLSDGTNPANTGTFLLRFAMPSRPFGVALGGGLAFIANGTSGLQVVNYLGFDTAETAPTIAFNPTSLDQDPLTAGIQVQERSLLNFAVQFADDVQLQRVEVLVDDVVVLRDASYPFELSAFVPAITAGNSTSNIQIRATDTGGNVTETARILLNLTPDVAGPILLESFPQNGSTRKQVPALTFEFNEALDDEQLNPDSIQVIGLGVNGVLGGGDDFEVPLAAISTRNYGHTLVLQPAESLVTGNYRVVISPTALVDRVGNVAQQGVEIGFTKQPAQDPALVFGSTVSGFLNNEERVDQYTFEGVAGERLYFDTLVWNNSTHYRFIISPSGQTLLSDADSDPFLLPETGTYTIRIILDSLSSTPIPPAAYSFRILDLREGAELTLNTVETGVIDAARGSKFYRMTATAGTRLHLDGLSGLIDPYGSWEVYDSNLNLLTTRVYEFSPAYGTHFDLDFTVPNDGEFYLHVWGYSSLPMAYNFQLQTATPQLLHFYSFDADVTDEVGNADGTVIGGAALAAGYEGQAIDLDGFDDYVAVSVDINPSSHPWVSMGAWVKADHNGDFGPGNFYIRTVLTQDDGGFDRGIAIDTRGDGQVDWSAFAGTGGVLPGSPATNNEWVFVAAVYDNVFKTVTLYVNDQVYVRTNVDFSDGHPFLHIGHNPDFQSYFDGLIDNVFVFDGILSAQEVEAIRLQGADYLRSQSQALIADPMVLRQLDDDDSLDYESRTNLDAVFAEDQALPV